MELVETGTAMELIDFFEAAASSCDPNSSEYHRYESALRKLYLMGKDDKQKNNRLSLTDFLQSIE